MCLFRHVWQLQPADVAASARLVLHEHALPEGGHQPIRQPTGADVGHAAAALPRFHARHHDIELDVRDFQQVTEGQMSGVDLMLVLGWPKAPDLVCRRIAAGRFIVVASPAYWAAHGMPQATDGSRTACVPDDSRCLRRGDGRVALFQGCRAGDGARARLDHDEQCTPRPGSGPQAPRIHQLAGCGLAKPGPLLRPANPPGPAVRTPQSACLRKNAGISISSMPLLDSASTLAAAWVRAERQTLGVLRLL